MRSSTTPTPGLPTSPPTKIIERLFALSLERAAEEAKQAGAPKSKTQRPKHHDDLV